MAVENVGRSKTYKAGADLRTKKNFLVKQSADDTVVLAAAATDIVVGVVGNKANTGELVEVIRAASGSTFKVVAGGTITRGARLVSDAAGKAIVATQTAAGSQPTAQSFGRALQAAVSGDIFEAEGDPILY